MTVDSVPAGLGEADRAAAGRHAVLSGLDAAKRESVLAECVVRVFPPGATIVAEGEPGSAMYLIVAGEAEVRVAGPRGETLTLARLGPGAAFGEQALLPDGAGRRSASVLAGAVAVRCVEIGRSAFLGALANDPSLQAEAANERARQLHERLSRSLVALGSIDLGALSKSGVSEVHFEPGQLVFRQGDLGDAVYFVIEGTVVVSVDRGGHGDHVARIAGGQCFGEQAVIGGGRRGATVTAESQVRALRVERGPFLEWYQESPDLHDLVQTLSRVYLDADNGLLTVHQGTWQGRPCVTSVRHRPDGTRMVATKVIGANLFTITRAGAEETGTASVVFADEPNGVRRELLLREGVPVGLVAQGAWTRLGTACRRVIEGAALPAWELVLFRKLGDFEVEPPAASTRDDDEVCMCMRLDRRELYRAMAAGHDDFEKLCAATGVGSVCAACIEDVHEIVGAADFRSLRVDAIERAARDVWRLRLCPTSEALPPARPGQHVQLRGLLDAGWVQRPYVLSDTSRSDAWEVLVRREPHGLFSRWVCGELRPGMVLRAGLPQGQFVLPTDAEADVVCLVAGIGVAPALAMARAHVAAPSVRSLRVHYSASRPEDFVARDEWEDLERRSDSLSVTFRATGDEGRLAAGDIQALVGEQPTARFMVCGPLGYTQELSGALAASGIAANRIAVEAFTSVGVPSTPAAPPPAPSREPAPEPSADDDTDEVRRFLSGVYSKPDAKRDLGEAFTERFQAFAEAKRRGAAFEPTASEWAHAARLAWGRRGLGDTRGMQVLDRRGLGSAEAVFDAVVEHLRLAFGGGRRRQVVTLFGPKVRMWPHGAGTASALRLPNGATVADNACAGVADALGRLGWRAPERPDGAFVALPVVLQHGDEPPRLFELPPEMTTDVRLAVLGVGWPALPPAKLSPIEFGGAAAASALTCEPCCAEDVAEALVLQDRFDLARPIAAALGIDADTAGRTELTRALAASVRASFEAQGVALDATPVGRRSAFAGPPRRPPAACPGHQKLPIVGPLLAAMATVKSPLDQALRCRAEYGDVFTITLPASPPMTYALGAQGYAMLGGLPVDVAGIGEVLMNVSVFSRWIPRKDKSPAYLELLALGGRAFLNRRMLDPAWLERVPALVATTCAARTAAWGGEMNLADVLISLVQSVSMRAIGGEAVWSRLEPRALPLLRKMAMGIDVPRLPLGATPARILLPEFWAARSFARMLRELVSEHDRQGGIELVDSLRREMQVDGRPLDERDLPWALNYVLFNACAYPGSYGFWSFVDVLADPSMRPALRSATADPALRLLEHAVLETIRLNPVTVAGRILQKPVRHVVVPEAGGGPAQPAPVEFEIPKGHILGVAPGSFTRDPGVYAEPNAYRPQRFERGEPIPDVFGGGAFGCVAGNYIRALLPSLHAWLLGRFDFELTGPLPPRQARPALHYPKQRVAALVTRRNDV